MTDLMRYAAALQDAGDSPLPPVERWRPERVGEIDIRIDADGAWFHEGDPIRRPRLARVFSTILRREGDDYFLVTPYEKLKIAVDDAPFIAVRLDVQGDPRRLVFRTNMGDQVEAGPSRPLVYRPRPGETEKAPYIEVRNGLEARVARTVFFELAELGEKRVIDGAEMFGVASAGAFFPFCDARELAE